MQMTVTIERQSKDAISWGGDRASARDCLYILIDKEGFVVDRFCPSEFHRFTNFSLRPGQKKKVRINIEAVE